MVWKKEVLLLVHSKLNVHSLFLCRWVVRDVSESFCALLVDTRAACSDYRPTTRLPKWSHWGSSQRARQSIRWRAYLCRIRGACGGADISRLLHVRGAVYQRGPQADLYGRRCVYVWNHLENGWFFCLILQFFTSFLFSWFFSMGDDIVNFSRLWALGIICCTDGVPVECVHRLLSQAQSEFRQGFFVVVAVSSLLALAFAFLWLGAPLLQQKYWQW